MHGQCDLPALHKALHKLVERHEALHTKISPEGDKQIICAHVRLEVPLLDWSNLAEGAYQQHIEQWLQQEISKPFKMDQAPLLRASILKKSETCHELVVLIHHMVADGWSWNILLHELSALYSAERHRQSAHLEIAH
jgi:iturin family lipopeptide synthetase A